MSDLEAAWQLVKIVYRIFQSIVFIVTLVCAAIILTRMVFTDYVPSQWATAAAAFAALIFAISALPQ